MTLLYTCVRADFVILDDSLTVQETYIAGELVWRK